LRYFSDYRFLFSSRSDVLMGVSTTDLLLHNHGLI
jgi:hypothetical protein